MRDTRWLSIVKRIARAAWSLDRRLGRLGSRDLRQERFVLTGGCSGCGACCERPSIQVPFVVFHAPLMRRAFLWWQRAINGFVFVAQERTPRMFVFQCTHYDPARRLCDSYDSRPGICRDYPAFLLSGIAPALFPSCGFRAILRDAERWKAALSRADLSAEQRRRLERDLHLD
ncbi:MAG: YkgJ family cysteine cluster protein [Vicinamibacteria bacterium]|nr:YkgJ family cysteine cluster protein [Vicinamibacteria bacterium]